MLTKNDLKAIEELIKTQSDLLRQDMATKSDLLDMARKSDLENMATKDDVNVMGKIFRIELAAQKREVLEAMKEGFQEVGKVLREMKKTYDTRIEMLEKQHQLI